ncbi:MAG: CopD family protein [Chloroflexi bacterium]|nr:CopD family protein [Chloroflexota bacterium]
MPFSVTPNTIAIWLHLLGAVVWTGSLLVQALIHSPLFSGVEPTQRARWSGELTRRLMPITWGSLVLLILTGIWNTVFNPVSSEPVTSIERLEALRRTPFGSALFIKHIFIVGTILLSGWHNFVLVPRLRRMLPTSGATLSSEAHGVLRLISWAAAVNLLVGIGVLFFAAQVLFSLR